MAITKARKFIELEKEGRKIMVALYEGGQVSSCVEEESKKYCETCQCDDETCQEWIEHLKGKGYQATEYELGELGVEESLPRFLEEKTVHITTQVIKETQQIKDGGNNAGEVLSGTKADGDVGTGRGP